MSSAESRGAVRDFVEDRFSGPDHDVEESDGRISVTKRDVNSSDLRRTLNSMMDKALRHDDSAVAGWSGSRDSLHRCSVTIEVVDIS